MKDFYKSLHLNGKIPPKSLEIINERLYSCMLEQTVIAEYHTNLWTVVTVQVLLRSSMYLHNGVKIYTDPKVVKFKKIKMETVFDVIIKVVKYFV